MPESLQGTAPVIAVCGKGGVGKTVFSALLARVFAEAGMQPLLLVDADPVGGLTSAIGEHTVETLSGVRDRVIGAAKAGGAAAVAHAAERLDYFVLKALMERDRYSLLAMGHNANKGCFCPANKLLRSAIESLLGSFAAVIIDAEAGIEQINRDVTEHVDLIIVVVDTSQRSIDTLHMIAGMKDPSRVLVVANRVPVIDEGRLPLGVALLGCIPEDGALRAFDQAGRSLWQLPLHGPAMLAVTDISTRLCAAFSGGSVKC